MARQLGIPAIEVQHGILYLGPGTFISSPPPEYIATYGPLTSAGFKRFGYTDDKLLDIGSPRFDEYKAMRERTAASRKVNKRFTVACIIPAVLPNSWSDAYEVLEYLSSMAKAVANIPNILVICKLRPISNDEGFYRKAIPRAFGKIPYRIVQYEPLVDVIAESDIVVTIYSTTVLEGLISGRPTIYNGTLEFHNVMGGEFAEYVAAGALIIAHTREELTNHLESLSRDRQKCKTVVEKADAFMKQNYSFDGSASKRLADSIRSLKSEREKRDRG